MSPEPPAEPPALPPSVPPDPPGGEAEGPRIPWEDRDRLGYVDALVETVKLLIMSPGEAFSRLRADGELIWPLIFGLIFSWFGQCFNQLWNVLFGEALRGMMSGFQGIEGFESFALYTGSNVLSAIFSIALWPIFFLIGIFIGTAILHLCLMVVGATTDAPMGFEGTLKVVAYSQIANLAAVVPLAGGLIAPVIGLILMAVGFAKVHQTTQGKAIVAVLIPVAFCCLCCVVFIFAALGSGFLAALVAGAGG